MTAPHLLHIQVVNTPQDPLTLMIDVEHKEYGMRGWASKPWAHGHDEVIRAPIKKICFRYFGPWSPHCVEYFLLRFVLTREEFSASMADQLRKVSALMEIAILSPHISSVGGGGRVCSCMKLELSPPSGPEYGISSQIQETFPVSPVVQDAFYEERLCFKQIVQFPLVTQWH